MKIIRFLCNIIAIIACLSISLLLLFDTSQRNSIENTNAGLAITFLCLGIVLSLICYYVNFKKE